MSDVGTNGNSSPLLCSDYRADLCEWVASYPRWRRWLLCCILRRRDAKLAWALGLAANEYLFEPGGTKIGDDLLRRADAIWADIYGYPDSLLDRNDTHNN